MPHFANPHFMVGWVILGVGNVRIRLKYRVPRLKIPGAVLERESLSFIFYTLALYLAQ